MSTETLEQTIRTIITELTAVPEDEINLEDRLREDLGMDSVSSMELISMLSEELDVDVELEDAMAVTDVKGVIALTQRVLENAD
ncbi:MAG: acyl carrier protein [Proteobacteria bacterium]|jgi:acyl carrier protein|nr:acyl carrier protein [Pseudomonadota bacterium]